MPQKPKPNVEPPELIVVLLTRNSRAWQAVKPGQRGREQSKSREKQQVTVKKQHEIKKNELEHI